MNYESLAMIDLEEEVMVFEFENEKDRERILNVSVGNPWALLES